MVTNLGAASEAVPRPAPVRPKPGGEAARMPQTAPGTQREASSPPHQPGRQEDSQNQAGESDPVRTGRDIKGFFYHVREYQRIRQQERRFGGKILHGLIDPFDAYLKAVKLAHFSSNYAVDGRSPILTDALVKTVLGNTLLTKKGREANREAGEIAKATDVAHEAMLKLAGVRVKDKGQIKDKLSDEQRGQAAEVLRTIIDRRGALQPAEIDALKAKGLTDAEIKGLCDGVVKTLDLGKSAGIEFRSPSDIKEVLTDQLLYAGLTPDQQRQAIRVMWATHAAAGATLARYGAMYFTGGLSFWASVGAQAAVTGVTRVPVLMSQGSVHKMNEMRGANVRSANAAEPNALEKRLSGSWLMRQMSVDWDRGGLDKDGRNTDPGQRKRYTWQIIRAAAFGGALGAATHVVPHAGDIAQNIGHNIHVPDVHNLTIANAASVDHGTHAVTQTTTDYLHAHGAQTVSPDHHTVVADARQFDASVKANADGSADLTLPPGDNAIGIPGGDGSVTMLHFDSSVIHPHGDVTTIHVGPNDPNYQALINSSEMHKFFTDDPHGGTMLDGVHNGATTTYVTGHWNGNVFEQHSTVNGSYQMPDHVTVQEGATDATQSTAAVHEGVSGTEIHNQADLLKNQQETPIHYEGDTIHHDWQQLHTYVHHDSSGHYWVEMKYQPQDAAAGQTQYLALIHDGKPIILDNNIKLDGNDYNTMINIYDTQGHVIDHMSSAQLAHWLGVDDQAKLQMFDKISTEWQNMHLKNSLPDDMIKYQGGNMSYTQHAADLYQNVGRQFGADGSPLLNMRVAGGHIEHGQFFAGASNQTGGQLPSQITLHPPQTHDLDNDEALFRTDLGKGLDRWTDQHMPEQVDPLVDNTTILNTDTWAYLWQTNPGFFAVNALPYVLAGVGYGVIRSRYNPPTAGKALMTSALVGLTVTNPIAGGITGASYLAARLAAGRFGGNGGGEASTPKEKIPRGPIPTPQQPFTPRPRPQSTGGGQDQTDEERERLDAERLRDEAAGGGIAEGVEDGSPRPAPRSLSAQPDDQARASLLTNPSSTPAPTAPGITSTSFTEPEGSLEASTALAAPGATGASTASSGASADRIGGGERLNQESGIGIDSPVGALNRDLAYRSSLTLPLDNITNDALNTYIDGLTAAVESSPNDWGDGEVQTALTTLKGKKSESYRDRLDAATALRDAMLKAHPPKTDAELVVEGQTAMKALGGIPSDLETALKKVPGGQAVIYRNGFQEGDQLLSQGNEVNLAESFLRNGLARETVDSLRPDHIAGIAQALYGDATQTDPINSAFQAVTGHVPGAFIPPLRSGGRQSPAAEPLTIDAAAPATNVSTVIHLGAPGEQTASGTNDGTGSPQAVPAVTPAAPSVPTETPVVDGAALQQTIHASLAARGTDKVSDIPQDDRQTFLTQLSETLHSQRPGLSNADIAQLIREVDPTFEVDELPQLELGAQGAIKAITPNSPQE